MLSHLRLVPSSLLRAASPRKSICRAVIHSRLISSSPDGPLGPVPPTPEVVARGEAATFEEESWRTEKNEEDHEDEEPEVDENPLKGKKSWMPYGIFIRDIAEEFRVANKPCNWIGERYPFPMNRTFKPATPISTRIKSEMYRLFMEDPQKNSVRALSQKYHLSLGRVDAILRLKGMEKSWEKGKKLETGFQAGMEYLLGVPARGVPMAEFNQARYDAHEGDLLQDDPVNEKLRLRYRRMFWETTSEGEEEPVLPKSIEHAEDLAMKTHASLTDMINKNEKLVPRIPDTPYMKRPTTKEVVREKEGRPTMRFVDVGAKFMDVEERVRRLKRSKNRAAKNEKKSRV